MRKEILRQPFHSCCKYMFIGEFTHNIDEKGRIAVPVKFRGELATGAVVTKGLDGCLFLYPLEEWKILAEKLSNLPISQNNSRAFSRHMLAGAMDVEVDKQGRIIVPEYLKNFAGISKKVVIAGLYKRIEIWDEAKWNEYKKSTEKESNVIAENLGSIGI